MKTTNRVWRGIACGGLSVALLAGISLPVSAWASGNGSSDNASKIKEHRQELRTMREKMLAEAKVEDAALQKMVAELNTAPEAKKADLEAAILTKLVAQHHRMLGQWESMHDLMVQFRKEHVAMRKNETPSTSQTHASTGQSTSTAQK